MDINRKIDINCDLGEGMPNDNALMPYISSCNIACGGHYGTKETISKAIRLAKSHKVKVGAHPSYPDKENFGRKSLNLSSGELIENLTDQISLFLAVCERERIEPNHIKLHGALYNDSSHNEDLANVIEKVCKNLNLNLPFYLPPNSILTKRVKDVYLEAFIDRGYQSDGSLVARNNPSAVIENPIVAWRQLSSMYFDHTVTSLEGPTILINASTYCLHGDNPNALEIAKGISRELKLLDISLDKNG